MKAAVGDWIVYYEPRRASASPSSRGGRQAYFATARVVHVAADARKLDHFYAYVADYLEFDRAVPFREGAHIRPVASGGADSVRNGPALSGTAHWMFDRGLLSIADDDTILVAHDRVPAEALRLIRPERRVLLPERVEVWPHPAQLRYHRERVFEGDAQVARGPRIGAFLSGESVCDPDSV